MKKIMFVLFLLSVTVAFAQVPSANGGQPQIYQFPSHDEHASYTPISQGQSISGPSNFAVAQGERPVWDFPQVAAVPLGTAARELRKQHAEVKKSSVVWIN
ncbi:MAG: hypothetical protein ABSD64_02840 [Terriglobales bacterium]|jgi:hypothetical protein